MCNPQKRKYDVLEGSSTHTALPRRNPGRTAKRLHKVVKSSESKDLTGLEALSGEIFNEIVSYLPIASVMALSVVNKGMHGQVTHPRNITPRELVEDRLSSTTALANQPLPIPKSKIPEQYSSISKIIQSSWSDQWALFDFEDRREKDLVAPQLKYTEIIVWLEVMDIKLLPLVTCSICGTRRDPKCFRGTSSPQRSYTRTCQSCLARYADVPVVAEVADKALVETRNPNRLKRLTCVMCENRRHTRDFPGFGPSQHMHLQKQGKRICWECLRNPHNATQIMIGTLRFMGINNLKGFLDGELECHYVSGGRRGSVAAAILEKAKADAAVIRSRSVWEFRDGRHSQRWERLARNLLAFRAEMECKTRLARKLHNEKLEEYRRGGLL